MTTAKLTPWFDANTKPTYPGVYETNAPSNYVDPVYQWWDGVRWHAFAGSPNSADRQNALSKFQNVKWRGLAERAK